MKLLSQRDPMWSGLHLGASPLTVGRYGCTTTCIAMLSDYFGCFMSPGQIARHETWYTKDGLVIWTNMAYDKMAFERREQGRNDGEIRAALKDPNRAVILQVDNGQHWVLALRKCLFSNDYIVADPWTGKKATACGTYHNITGASYYKRK